MANPESKDPVLSAQTPLKTKTSAKTSSNDQNRLKDSSSAKHSASFLGLGKVSTLLVVLLVAGVATYLPLLQHCAPYIRNGQLRKDPTGECSRYYVQALVALPSLISSYRFSMGDIVKYSTSLAYPIVRKSVADADGIDLEESSRIVYEKGPLDVVFILAAIVILSVIQKSFDVVIRYWFLATSTVPASRRDKEEEERRTIIKTAHKFSEQFYLFSYYICSMSLGLYVYRYSKYFPLNTMELWTDYPVYRIPGVIKLYYLVTGAFWLQQLLQFALFTPVQERRKDHWPMTIHHFVTCCLVLGSYFVHCTRTGNAVLIVMDAADIFLTLAKCLKYMGKKYQTLCDTTFGMFALSWLFTRHGLYFVIIYSLIYECHVQLESTPYDPYMTRRMLTPEDWKRPGSYFSISLWGFFFACFVVLQALLIFWFALIVKVVMKVLSGQSADDVREDDEDD